MKTQRIPWYLVLSMLVSGTAAVIASLVSIQSLAVWADWSDWAAYLIPLTLDSLGASCITIWAMSTVDDDARRYARQVALLTIGVSALLNALAHIVVIVAPRPIAGVEQAITERSGWEILIIVTIAAIPPLALAGVIELAVKMRKPIVKTTPRRSQPKVTDVRPEPVVVQPPSPTPAVPVVDVPRQPESLDLREAKPAPRARRTATRPKPDDLRAEDAVLIQVLTEARAERDDAWNASAVRRWLASPEGQAKLALAGVAPSTIPGAGRARRLASHVEEAWAARQNGHTVEA